jgi:acetoacetyl-CoA synthetase
MPIHLDRFLSFTGHPDYASLHHWSVTAPAAFWATFREFAALPAAGEPFNFTELLLRYAGPNESLVYHDESGATLRWSGHDLVAAVTAWQQLLLSNHIAPGDRIVAITTNHPQAIAIMLATASIGAIFSSCSPDFGAQGIIDRFAQLSPRLLFYIPAYTFAGKPHTLVDRLAAVTAAIPSLEATYDLSTPPPPSTQPLSFTPFPHRHPLFILFSSGTTGLPKCIIHSTGGTLVQIVKEHLLHVDLHPGEKLFYYTTCGWMMWNWLALGLASGATLVLYHGSPMHPDPGVLWRIAAAESIPHFGTSAKYLALLEKSGYTPRAHHDLTALRQILSTGSPLAASSFDYVDQSIKPGVHLASISGGTDIISCFVLGNPLAPVTRGEIQVPGLGMDVQIWSPTGERLYDTPGELVCVNQFPSMPLGFWNDPTGTRYQQTYFSRFPNVWCHGDWASQSSTTGGFLIYGRSDTTLNPGGIRIGTAEIYRQVDTIPEVEESVAVGQQWQGDVRIILFVKLRPGHQLTKELTDQIRHTLRTQASPHHVPRKILAVTAIPRTVSNKISEAAVTDAIHSRPSTNRNALANPESLDEYTNRPELLTD